jgi:multiple antibiotic resistance protein
MDILHTLLTSFCLSVAVMFPIINPVGHAPMFYAMTKEDSPEFRALQAFKTSVYSFLILLVSLLAGSYVLRFFGIDLNDLRIAGGLLVCRSAWHMLGNASKMTPDEHAAAASKEDISLTPMATPILSGPGAMSLAIGLVSYGRSVTAQAGYILGFAAIGLMIWASFRYAERLARFLGENGAGALNRVLGFFIMAIGVNLIVDGVKDILLTHL